MLQRLLRAYEKTLEDMRIEKMLKQEAKYFEMLMHKVLLNHGYVTMDYQKPLFNKEAEKPSLLTCYENRFEYALTTPYSHSKWVGHIEEIETTLAEAIEREIKIEATPFGWHITIYRVGGRKEKEF